MHVEIGVWTQLPAEHASVVQGLPSSQLMGVPLQSPPVQVSPAVQSSPSLHVVPSEASGSEQVPDDELHVPATWH